MERDFEWIGRLPVGASDRSAPEWWGMAALILIEAVVFTGLIVSYFHFRTGSLDWPQGGISTPDLLLPTLNTLILIASAAPIWWGERAIKRGEARKLRMGLFAGQMLLAVFLVLKVVEYSGYDYNWTTNAYGSVVWTMTGLHVAHVGAVMLKSGAIGVLALRGYFTAERHVAITTNALYWYFVVGIWLPLYTTIYLSPRVF